MAAIGRIEILKDGAAATYGSDAVAGVVNFITKRGFEGMSLEASYNYIEDSDGDYTANALVRLQGRKLGHAGRRRLSPALGAEHAGPRLHLSEPRRQSAGRLLGRRQSRHVHYRPIAAPTGSFPDPGCARTGRAQPDGRRAFINSPRSTTWWKKRSSTRRTPNSTCSSARPRNSTSTRCTPRTMCRRNLPRPRMVRSRVRHSARAAASLRRSSPSRKPTLVSRHIGVRSWSSRRPSAAGDLQRWHQPRRQRRGVAPVRQRRQSAHRRREGRRALFRRHASVHRLQWRTVWHQLGCRGHVRREQQRDQHLRHHRDPLAAALQGFGGPNCSRPTAGRGGCLWLNPFSTAVARNPATGVVEPETFNAEHGRTLPELANWLFASNGY